MSIYIVDLETGERYDIIKRKWSRDGMEYTDITYDDTTDPSLAFDNIERILGERGERTKYKKDRVNLKLYDERNWNFSWRVVPDDEERE